MIDALLNVLAAFQDYGWFFALLGWSIAIVLWSRIARGSFAWRWLPWSAAAGIANALVELVMIATPVELSPTHAPHRFGDWMLGGCTVIQITGWLATVMIWRPARCAAIVVLPLYCVARFWIREDTNLGLLIAAVLAAGLWCRRLRGEGRRPVVALLVSLLALAAASHGVAGDWTGQSRAWVEASRTGFLGALLQTAAAATAVTAMARLGAGNVKDEDRASHQHDIRRMLQWGGLWLAAGVVLATGAAWLAQRNYSALMRQRAVTMAALLDKPALVRALGPSFQIDEYLPPWKQPSGRVSLFGYSNWHRGEAGETVRQMLDRIRRHNPDVRDVGIRMVWDKRVINCLHPQLPEDQKYNGIILVEGPADEIFQRDWDARAADFRGLLDTSYDEIAQARAPLIGPEGQMLGWLLLDSGVSHWIAVQAQARIQGYFVVLLGLGVAGLWVLQRRRERQREEARRAADVARAANEAKSAVLATVNHELRAPLQTILMIAELLGQDLPPGEARERVELLIQQIKTLQRMVNDLIDLSALSAGRPTLQLAPTDVLAVLVGAAEMLRARAAARKLRFSVATVGSPLWAMADATRLGQIVTNLLGNAVKFTAQGSVGVDLACHAAEGGRVAVSIVVSDTGPGLTPEQIDRLFQPFSRVDPRQDIEGAGLGLAIVRGLCVEMNGQVRAESDGRTGSRFTAELLLLRCDPEDERPGGTSSPPRPTSSPVSPRVLRGLRVLIADDNALVRQLFAMALLRQQASCRTVADGVEALEWLKRDEFDAALLDLEMPRMNGFEVAREVRALGLKVRLIACSAHSRPQDREAALAAGFDVVLTKPVPLEDLLRAVDATKVNRADVPESVRRALEEQFRRMVPEEIRAVEAAIERRDWALLLQRAHGLKNSAFAVGDDALLEGMGVLENAARTGELPRIEVAWRDGRRLLENWLPPAG